MVFDTNRCSAIGLCEAAMPDVFELGSDGVLHVLRQEVGIERRRQLEEAASNCPTGSISVQVVE